MEPAALVPLELLPENRQEILELLKLKGPLPADALAEAAGLSVSGVRQLLSSLEGSGLVTHRRDRDGPGRPRHLYELTEDGDALFARRYGDLANELLGYVEELGDDLLDRIFERRRHRRLDEARRRLEGLGFAAKVRELAEILDEDGYLTEVREADDGGFLIVEHNCAVRQVAERYGQACSSEIGFLRDALPEAEIERVTHIVSGEPACSYAVRRTSNSNQKET